MMRKLSADYIFTSVSPPLKRGILILEDDGTVCDVIDTSGNLEEIANLEYYNGILIPGLVNCHCHLEYSWTANSIPMHTGLPGFIERMISLRRNIPVGIESSCIEASDTMFANGISLVGDITGSSQLFNIKSTGSIQYVNFIELLNTVDSPEQIIDLATKLVNASESSGMPAYLSPHAPYSVSSSLFKLIQSTKPNAVYAIHNQESNSENLWFRGEKNQLSDLFAKFKIESDPLHSAGISSLQTISEYFPKNSNILLIHNVATSRSDIEFIDKIHDQTFWILCPNSNLYISNSLPDFNLFRSAKCNIALGTDGLGSNASLSILDEILTIHSFAPDIPLEELIKWGTINGAHALKLNNKFGSFEKGKMPGVNLLQNIDLQNLVPTSTTSIKRLV